MKKRMMVVALLLIMVVSGCAYKEPQGNLMQDVVPNDVSTEMDVTKEEAITDFGVRLFQNSLKKKENTLVSPLSVIYALGMTANGAKGETLAQMEAVFGISVPELNEFLHAYMNALPNGEKYKLQLANAIWFKEDGKLKVNDAFIQTNADYYGAGIYQAPFDESTLRDINDWVNEKTEERIPHLLDKISDDEVMYLINALAFDAEWDQIYEDSQVREGKFTKEDGTTKRVDFMNSEEYQYLETNNVTGFVKDYAEQKYAFVALLPKPGMSIEDYVNSLDGKELQELLQKVSYERVKTSLPKFETECAMELVDVLEGMGMKDAFDVNKANLSGIGEVPPGYNLVISRVIHKTYICVGEEGTKAGAATAVGVDCGTTAAVEQPKVVYLNRPFVYAIVDYETKLPIFIGTVMDIAD